MHSLIGNVSKEQQDAFFNIERMSLTQLRALTDDCLVKFNETIKEKDWFIRNLKVVSDSYSTYFAIDGQNNLTIKYDEVKQVQLSVIWHVFDRMFHGMPDIIKLYNVFVKKHDPRELAQHIIDGNHINLLKLLLKSESSSGSAIQWNTFQIKSSMMRFLINEKSQDSSPK